MKKLSILACCIAIALVAAIPAMADTVTLANSLSGLVYYDGEYCGTIGATLSGTTDSISNGIACVDIAKTTYIGATINVNISTLSSTATMTNARFGSDGAAILKYEEAAWLLGQMPSHADQVGEIQFAMWRLFNPNYAFQANADRKKGLEDDWLGQAAEALIHPEKFDFSSVSIYTPFKTDTSNQEFMSGAAISRNTAGNPVPIPASFVLLGSGLLGLGLWSRRKKAVPVQESDKDRT